MTVMESIECLDQLVDESDPDVDFANSYHAFQTAEGIRKEHPDKGEDWAWPSQTTENLWLQSVNTMTTNVLIFIKTQRED